MRNKNNGARYWDRKVSSQRNKKPERHRIAKSNDMRFNIRQIFFSLHVKIHETLECKNFIILSQEIRNGMKSIRKNNANFCISFFFFTR